MRCALTYLGEITLFSDVCVQDAPKLARWAGWAFSLALFGLPAWSQTPASCKGPDNSGAKSEVTGKIHDPGGAAVPGATVSIECGAHRFETTTNGEGNYQLSVPSGSWRFRVRSQGFSPLVQGLVLPTRQSMSKDASLSLLGTSETITVTAGGYEQLLDNAPASVTVVTSQELATKRVSDIGQALIDVEGVDVGQNVGKTGGLTVSMRGMPSDYTLMLIDGRRQNSPGSVTPNGFGETATTFMPPVAAIDRIEVVRGPMSTLYGSDAMGGVVNIITKKVGEKWGGSFTADGTLQSNRSYGDTGQGSIYLSGPVIANRIGLALRGRVFHREAAALRYENVDGQDVPITSFGLSPTQATTHNFGGRANFILNQKNDFYADFDRTSQLYNNDANQLGTATTQGGYAPKMRFDRQQVVLSHNGRYGVGLLDSSFTHNTTSTDGRTIPPGTPGATTGASRTLDASNTLLDSKLVTTLGSKHMVTVGGQWWKANMVDGVAPAPFDFRQSALFAEDEWNLMSKLAVTLGARWNHHSTFGSNFSPRAYLVYTPAQRLTLKAGISRGFRTPQLNQLATGIVGFGGQGTIPLIGSPGLKPETSTSTEVAAILRIKAVHFTVTGFNNEFQDKIANGPGLENCSFRLSPNRAGCVDFGSWPNVDLFSQSINVDEAVTRGVEASMRFRLIKKVEVQNNYTFTRSEQRSGAQAGQPLVNTPKHMYNSTVRYNVHRRWNAWVRVEARSNRTRGTGATADAATAQIGPFKGYGLAHLGFGFEITKSLMLNGTIYNLLNTDFLQYSRYVQNGVASYASLYNNLQEPRRAWLSLTYTF